MVYLANEIFLFLIVIMMDWGCVCVFVGIIHTISHNIQKGEHNLNGANGYLSMELFKLVFSG